MAGKIILGSFKSIHSRFSNPSNLQGCCRFSSQYVAAKIHISEGAKPQEVASRQLPVKDVRFIGSERLRSATPKEIQNDPKLLKELGEAYEMMAQDEEVARATDFCARVMLNRRSTTSPLPTEKKTPC